MPAALTALSATTPTTAMVQVLAFDDFTALRVAAPELIGDTGEVFSSLDWFETLSNHGFDPQARRVLLLATKPGLPPVCLPVLADRELRSLSNFYSALFAPISPMTAADSRDGNGDRSEQLTALAQHLYAAPQRWPLLCLHPLDQEGAFYRDFGDSLRRAGYWVDSFHCFANWTLLLNGRNFEHYFSSLPSRLQNTIRRAQRKLERDGQLSVLIHRDPGPALDAAIADFESIYAASWKEPEPYPDFIGAWCRRAAASGRLRLGVLALDGQALAAQIWLLDGGKASIFKLAYREGAQPYSPGSVLTAALMRQVIDDDGVHEVDFLSGDDAYKQDWMSHRRERRGLIAFRRDSVRGLLAGTRHALGKCLRAWRRG